MTTGAIDFTGLDGRPVSVDAARVEALSAELDGPVLHLGDPGWDDALLIWNAMVASVPALVVQPTSVDDVRAAVRFAAEQGVLLTVKGGGHNIAGTSLATGGLALDMSRMRAVEVDPEARLVRAGPGCLLKDVDAGTQEHGLATVLGFVSETGVAGLTLGGGFGYLTRRFGWTVDSLVAVEIVTADGRVTTASEDENPDLFWALRGGGGNFGVVTGFTFRLYDVGPMITGGLILWSAERADEVMAAYRELTASAPRDLTAALTIRLAPPAPFIPPDWHGKPVVGVICCHVGENAAADLAGLRALGDPIVDLVTEKPYAAQQGMVDATQPKGLNYYWKTEFLPDLSPAYLEAFKTAALQVTSPLSQSIIFHIGGALNERPGDDGAVGNRTATFVSGFAGCWPPTDPGAGDHIAWVRGSWETIRGFSTGGNYVNFQLADDDAARTAAAYGDNFERLQRVKAEYDPRNVFRVNRNVAPQG